MNGCGSYNISLDFGTLGLQEFTDCCNVHDLCYEDCDDNRKSCDDKFQVCLTSQCDTWTSDFNWGTFKKYSNRKLFFKTFCCLYIYI